MATNPQTYSVDVIFEDGTQHTYDNVPEGVTSDEVYQRAQRDFKDKFVEELFRRPIAGQAQPAPSPRTAPAPKVPAETPVASPAVTMEPTTNDMGLPAFEPRGPIVAPKPRAEDYEFGMDRFGDFSPELPGLTKPQEAIVINMANNPNIPAEEVDKYLQSIGIQAGGSALIDEINRAREEKRPFGSVIQDNPFEGMVDEEAIKAEYAPQSDNVFAQVGRSIMESYSNPASLMNFLDRSKLDFFNFYGDELKARFPDATPEELEQLEEQYIGYMARMRGQAAAEGVKNDDFIPWLFGQFIALEPTDALIPARAARAATKAGRILEKTGEGALVGAGTDLAGQALAMSDYAQDELDPVSLAASGALSGALGNVGQRIDEAFNPAPASFEQGPRIEAPTARSNSKKYNEQLVAANDVVTERATAIANNWTNPPASVRVEPNFKKEEGIDDDALGVYTADGEVVLNTEAIISYANRRNITPEQMTEGVLFHEALGHHGLTQTFGDQLDEVLDVLYTEGKAEFRDKVDQWIARNTKKDSEGNIISEPYPSPNNEMAVDPKWQRIRATEEVLANMAEEGLIDRSLLDRLIDFIKRTARRVGLDKLAQRLDEDIGKYSTREIRGILAISQRNVTQGDPTNFKPGFVKNKIVYHGSGADFNKFDHVIFDDNTPKIVNKYMKPSDTTSAGFKRTKMDERSANEARKQFWRNKDNPDWDSSDPNGLSAKVRRADRYMRGDAVDPETMDADDLIYSEDAAGLLDRILDYNPTAVDISAIEQDLISRGVPPSSVTRLAKTNPGDLVRRRMRYDIAAMKLNDRVLEIQEDIRTNGLTEEKQLEYLKADSALKDIATAIFDLDSEFGRSLNLLKKMSMTRRKATNIREFLREADAGEALADPETFMNYMAKRQEAIEADKAKNTNSIAYDVFGAPRAIMSSYDLSAPMRQGISLIGTTQYWKSFFKMFTFIGPSGKENYNWLMKTIARHPNYELMLKARLAFSDVDGKFATREEDFRSDLAKKIPGVSLSEQAYAGFLNKLRADTFNKMVELIREPDGTVSDAALADLGKFINSATGRAELPKDLGAFSIRGKKISEGVNLQAASPLLNTAFFSPRLIASRFNMINPKFYANLDPRIRKQAILESAKAGGIVLAATMLLGSMTPGAEVELDPRSSDFMKIKVDDTRFDLMGGFSQYLTFAARTYLAMQNALVGGMVGYTPEVKTTTGRLRDLDGRGVYGQTYADIFTRFFRGKLSPNVSYVWDAFDGENVVGEEFNVVNSAYDRMLPLAMSSLFENVEQHGLEKGLRYAAPNVFGISVNTFVPEERNPNQSIESPDEFEGAKLDRAARDWWESRENALFKTYVINYTGKTGFEWKDLPPRSQEKIIEWAREDAREMVREQAKIELMEKSE